MTLYSHCGDHFNWSQSILHSIVYVHSNGTISTLNVKLSTVHAPITVLYMDEVLCNYSTCGEYTKNDNGNMIATA